MLISFRLKKTQYVGQALALVASLLVGSLAFAQTDAAPADTETLVEDGSYYLDTGDCAVAQFFFQEALRLEPENTPAFVGKGRSLSCQGAYGAAIEAFQSALSIDPNQLDALNHLAITYQAQYQADPATYAGRLADALDIILRAERVRADDARVQNTKGIVLLQLGDLDAARQALESAVDLAAAGSPTLGKPEQSTIHVNLGRVYRDAGELQLAQQSFRRAVVLNPTSSTAHNLLGNIALRLDDCSTAEYELSQAVNLDPTSLSAASQLGISLFECGDVQGSIPRLEAATKLPGAAFLPPLFTYLARAYLEVGRVDDAVFVAQQGALLQPETAEAYYWLGQSYTQRGGNGDGDNARRAYERSLELDGAYSPSLEALGR